MAEGPSHQQNRNDGRLNGVDPDWGKPKEDMKKMGNGEELTMRPPKPRLTIKECRELGGAAILDSKHQRDIE